MPYVRKSQHDERSPLAGKARQPSILRPLLNVSRAQVERYALRRKLAWIEDESNADSLYQRNWLRHDILPRVAERVPGYLATLTRAARHFAEAAELLDELGRADADDALITGTMTVERLRALSSARAKNAIRAIVASRGWPMPQAERLQEALRQALTARSDANLRVDLGSCELRRYRERIYLVGAHAVTPQDVTIWRGECELPLPGFGGVLMMTPGRGSGIDVGQLRSAVVTIRRRAGGERLQLDAGRPRRSVKNLLQEAMIPAWERARLPFIYCGDTLACIPGVAIDYRYRAAAGKPAISPVWQLI
jgi:tRNA(Ile)-lysidine synthase